MDDREQINLNKQMLSSFLSNYNTLQSEMKITRGVDIPNLHKRDHELEVVTAQLTDELNGMSKRSLRELSTIINNYLSTNVDYEISDSVKNIPMSETIQNDGIETQDEIFDRK